MAEGVTLPAGDRWPEGCPILAQLRSETGAGTTNMEDARRPRAMNEEIKSSDRRGTSLKHRTGGRHGIPRRSDNCQPRERAGRVKTAQRRRAVLTRPSAPEQSNTGATRGGAVTAPIDAQTRLASTRSGSRRPAEELVSARGTASAPLATRVRSVERPPIEP